MSPGLRSSLRPSVAVLAVPALAARQPPRQHSPPAPAAGWQSNQPGGQCSRHSTTHGRGCTASTASCPAPPPGSVGSWSAPARPRRRSAGHRARPVAAHRPPGSSRTPGCCRTRRHRPAPPSAARRTAGCARTRARPGCRPAPGRPTRPRSARRAGRQSPARC